MGGANLGRSPAVFMMVPLVLLLFQAGIAGSEGMHSAPFQVHLSDTLSIGRGEAFFTENIGQWPMEVALLADVKFGQIGLSGSSFLFDLASETGGRSVLRYDLIGSSGSGPVGTDMLSHRTNFFYGNDPSRWVTGARSYRGALYEDAWDGIDVLFAMGDEGVKYEFHVGPFADPHEISFSVSGHKSMVSDGCSLNIVLENGMVFGEAGLKAFYLDDEDELVGARFRVDHGDRVSFDLEAHDPSRVLVIDPLLLNSTFVGGYGSESDGMLVKDENGSIYMAGSCGASGFPTTPGAYDGSWNLYYDTVVLKMDALLSGLAYSTYFGGKDAEWPTDIEYAGNGEVIVVGKTNSDDLPTTNGSYQRRLNATELRSYDAFLFRLNGTGGGLVGSTYIGWKGSETDPCVGLDPNGCPVVAFGSASPDIPITDGCYDGAYNGGLTDTVIIMMDRNLTCLSYATYVGGSGKEEVSDLFLGRGGLLLLAGTTSSSDHPTTRGSYQMVFNTSFDTAGWVLSFDMTDWGMVFSSFINAFHPMALVSTSNGDVAIGGWTNSSAFETTEGSFQRVVKGDQDAAVLVMYGNGSGIVSSTLLGGPGHDTLADLDLNGTGHIFLICSADAGFPVTPSSYSTKNSGMADCSVSVLSPDLGDLIYSTYVGGTRWESPCSIVVDRAATAYISGNTASGNYPTTPPYCHSSVFGGTTDMFVSRIECPKIFLPPLPARNFTGRMFDDHIELFWDVPLWDGDAPVLGYNISRAALFGPHGVVGTTQALSFNDTEIDIKLTYEYYVTAFNRIGDSLPTRVLTLWEMTPPRINSDLTEPVQPPGGYLQFALNVTDNSALMDVRASVQREGKDPLDLPMSESVSGIYTCSIVALDEEYSVNYSFTAVDIKGNMVMTNLSRVDVAGEYLPVFVSDLTQGAVVSLQPITFETMVRDNWAPPTVHLEFWTGSGLHRNVTMDRSGSTDYYFRTRATGRPGDLIHYVFRAEDLHGNWNTSEQGAVQIIDGYVPDIVSDLSSTRPTTGDPYEFRTLVHDDVYVSGVDIDYRFGDGPIETGVLKRSPLGVWSAGIVVPDSLCNMEHRFIISDASGNVNTTAWASAQVTDNDPPAIEGLSMDGPAMCGGTFLFHVEAQDNIAIDDVIADLYLNGSHFERTALTGVKAFSGSVKVPLDAMGSLDIVITVTDTSGNEVFTGLSSIKVMDNVPPTIGGAHDIVTYVGCEVNVRIELQDNIRVASVAWEGLPEEAGGTCFTIVFGTEGEHRVVIEATDPSGNTGGASFLITVLPEDHDSDGDGMPDLFEMDHGLDPMDAGDGLLDMDGDDLTNADEYGGCSKIDMRDTDSDGMDDGWEVRHGMDPDRFSAFEDMDGDGRTDLEEFLEGTDPTIPDGPPEKGTNKLFVLKVVAFVIISMVSLLVLSLVLRMRRTKRVMGPP